MLFDLPNAWIITLNVLGIPAVHILIAWWSMCLSGHHFRTKQPFTLEKFNRPISGIYENVFFIRLWKDSLPDAGPWFNGFSKGKLEATDTPYLTNFVLETRRGEFSHFVQAAAISLFVLWNPYPANYVIIGYAILSNLPCILNQRFTRHRILKLLHKRAITL